ncbi:MAG: LD-carboxypeptidase [Christensenellales bacterium]|jgi:muramoyltetrapeptide carboxypeptidase
MIPARLHKGDAIGIASPSRIATPEIYDPVFRTIEEMGFRARPAKTLYASGWGFSATPNERAEALHELSEDDNVKMIFFGGGEGADDVILALDYARIARHPKIWLGFSDATSILHAVHNRCGFDVYYGLSPIDLIRSDDGTRDGFLAFVAEGGCECHRKSSSWHILTRGRAEGILSAGYLENYTYLANAGWIVPEADKKYILCLEEHSMFFGVEHVSGEIGRLENSPMMAHTAGILFGEYSEEIDEHLLFRLRVLGKKYGIPMAYCHDFGHGRNKSIFRIGARVALDTSGDGELRYLRDDDA